MKITKSILFAAAVGSVSAITVNDMKKCMEINVNDFSTFATMQAAGWSSTKGTRHHHAGVGSYTRAGAVCNNGQKNWWGWKNGAAVGEISVASPVTSDVTIDVGNCWNRGTVKVYVDDKVVATARVNQGSVKATFRVAKGQRIRIRDEGRNSVMRINSIKIHSCTGTATDRCEAVNTNDFSDFTQMKAVGWTTKGAVRHHHAFVGSYTRAGAVCNNGQKNWWGWENGRGVGSLQVVAPISTTASIDVGNCWNQGKVKVDVDGKVITVANVGEGSKKMKFTVKAGQTITIRDTGANSVMRLNSLTFDDCTGMKYASNPARCGEWTCAEWCKYFDETVEADGAYLAAGCAEDGVDACTCEE